MHARALYVNEFFVKCTLRLCIPPHSLLSLDINFALRKIVCLLKPDKHITHDVNTGAMTIRTVTTFRNFNMDFTIGEEFTEDLGPVDGRTCQVIGT